MASHGRAAAFNPHFERVLNTIQYGTDQDAISLFTTDQYSVNQEIEYVFDDRMLYRVTPLNWAVRYNKQAVCKYLLDHGARPYCNLVYEYYPLHEACCRGFDKIVAIFIKLRCDLNRTTPTDLDTPLHVACVRGNVGCVHLLLRANANPNLRNAASHTPLEAAVYSNQDDMVKMFAAHGITSGSSVSPTTGCTATIAVSTVSATTNASRVLLQRRHSINTPSTQPMSVHNGPCSSRPHTRPSSVYVDGATDSCVNSLSSTKGHSPQRVTTPSPPDSRMSVRTTAPSMSQLTVTQGESNVNSSYSSRPSYISQLSIASASSANSPSPVERDGVCQKSWTGDTRNLYPTTSSAGYYIGHSISKMTSENHTEIAQPTGMRPATTALVSSSKSCNQYTRLVDSTNAAVSSPGADTVTTYSAPPVHLTSLLSNHRLTQRKQGESFQKDGCGRMKSQLFESSSNPEFPLVTQRRTMPQQDRTQSFDSISPHVRTLTISPATAPIDTQTPSPSRERINMLSHFLCSALETLRDGPSDTRGSPSCDIIRKLSEDVAQLVDLSPEQLQSLVDVASSVSTSGNTTTALNLPSSVDSISTIPLLSSGPVNRPTDSLREAGLNVDENPQDVRLADPMEGYMSVIFKLRSEQSRPHEKRTRTSKSKNEVVKVFVRVFNLLNPVESNLYHSLSSDHSLKSDHTSPFDHLNEITVLQKLSTAPHPNVAQLVSHFKANVSNQYDRFARQVQPTSHETIYVTGQIADFAVLSSPSLSLGQYFEDLKSPYSSSFCGVPESKILSILAQVLMGEAHLNKNRISHNAIHQDNIFVDAEDRNTIVIANFGSATLFDDSTCEDAEMVLQTKQKLKLDLASTNSYCRVAPEVHEALDVPDLEESVVQNVFHGLFQTSDSYAAAQMMYELLLGPSHKFILELGTTCYSYDHIPSIPSLSLLSNHLLKNLFAYDPSNRLSALEGAMASLVLLLGPHPSTVSSVKECKEWLFAETVEFYMRPSLKDTSSSDYSDSQAKLLCMYLTIANANPSLVWDACRFFQEKSV